MADISALQDALSGVVPDTGFMLDNRTALYHLKFLEQYARHIPYSGNLSWADYLFMNGNTPEKLAELYQNPSKADGHLPPHQAMLLALLAMQETPKALMNYFPDAHCDLYYRQLLQLRERDAVPSQVVLGIELESSTPELMVPAGTLFSAGQDNQGTPVEFGLDADLLANQGVWSDLRWCLPSTEAATGTSAIVYDDEQSWPKEGMPLFSPVEQDIPILTGRMLASAGLTSDPNFEYRYTVTFSAPLVDVYTWLPGAEISSGSQWLALDALTYSDTNGHVLTLSLPLGRGETSAPEGLDGAEFTVPVLRLSGSDGQSLPAINDISVSYIYYTLDANGEQVPHESTPILIEYEQVIMTPFGHAEQEQPVDEPQLYWGIRDLQVGQTLSLYWKLNSPGTWELRWQYLTVDNQWQTLEEQMLDNTLGLFRSGLWTLNLPDNASNNAPAMPSGRYWFRACFTGTTSSTGGPWLIGMTANAMTATLNNVDTLDSQVTGQPLPAGSIRYPASNVTGLAGAEQPWESWGGRPPESSEAFFSRSAQRLSHRNRALTWSDMVLLLKNAFPYVFDVLTPSGQTLTTVPALNTQLISVIPLTAERDNDDALRPVFNASRLEGMRRFLQLQASLWQNIQVVNPRYCDVALKYNVVFRAGVNPVRAEQDLRDALTAEYMPWSTGSASAVTVANRIDYYEVMASLQQQPYVDYVISLTLDDAENSVQGDDDEVLILCWPVENVRTDYE